MAERRMFAKTIIDSDAFLEMPSTSQLLYFHLSMRADDEGFINKPKTIMRIIGAKDDDMKLLILKKFIIPFESGVVVVKHWKIHNYIQNDRLHATKYQEEKSMLSLDENKAYKMGNEVLYPKCIQDVSKMDTEVRLGKVSLIKDNIIPSSDDDCDSHFTSFWKAYPKKVGKGDAEKKFKKLKVDDTLLETMLSAISNQKRTEQWQDTKYIPNPSTWLNQMRWEDEVELPEEEPPLIEYVPPKPEDDAPFRKSLPEGADLTAWLPPAQEENPW